MKALELNNWSQKCFRRILVDMHIPDWDERFLSKLDADTYVKTVAKGNSGGIMLYCNSHVGPTLYPSNLGPVHKAIGNGDFVADTLAAARRKKLFVVAYYSAVFNNAAFLEHPDWRIIPPQGEAPYLESRYGTCCPNSPYRDFAVAQAEAPTLIRYGQQTSDEFYVSEKTAREGVVIKNPSATDPLVMLKHFGPENPELIIADTSCN